MKNLQLRVMLAFVTIVGMTVAPAAAASPCEVVSGAFNGSTIAFLDWLGGPPLHYGVAVALVAGLILVLFEGAHLPNFAKWGFSAIIILFLTIAFIKWLVSIGGCGHLH